jgi:hypothetical protein
MIGGPAASARAVKLTLGSIGHSHKPQGSAEREIP